MDYLQIVLFIFLFIWSAFFSGTEIALMSLPDHKLSSLLKQKKFWAKCLKKIKQNNDKLLITILIWNNLVNVYTAALATTIAIWIAEKSWLPQTQAVWIATWIITFLLLLFWEIIPKSFATKNSATISLFVAPIYKILMLLLFPIIYVIEIIIRVFSWSEKVNKMTDEEIESFIDMGRKAWTLQKEEHEKIRNILEFSDILVEEIMIPRVKIDRISFSSTVWEALDYYLKHTHSRIPVYNNTIDKIDFFVTIRDLIWQDKNKKISELNLTKVLKVPLNQPINKLLKIFQNTQTHLAIVIDEYGWVAWLITLEDILEEIFWEIRDETDNEIDEIKEISKDNLVVESYALIEEVLEKLWLDLESIWLDKKEFDWETLSYVITHKLEWFPVNWEKIEFNIQKESQKNKKLELTVLSIYDWKIWKVEVKKI